MSTAKAAALSFPKRIIHILVAKCPLLGFTNLQLLSHSVPIIAAPDWTPHRLPGGLYQAMPRAVLPARAPGDRCWGRRRSPRNASYLDR